jgi:hypothetical protein
MIEKVESLLWIRLSTMSFIDFQHFATVFFSVFLCIIVSLYLYGRFRHRLGVSLHVERCPKCRTRIARNAFECPHCGVSVLKERYWCWTCLQWILRDHDVAPYQPFAYAIKGETQEGNLTLICPICMNSLLDSRAHTIVRNKPFEVRDQPSYRPIDTERRLIGVCFIGGLFCLGCIGLMFVFQVIPPLQPYIDVLFGLLVFCLLFSFLLFGATAFYIERKIKRMRENARA